MTTSASKPDASIVIDLIEAFRRSKAMFAAVELGVFEGRREGKEIGRLLDGCVSLGLLEKRADGSYVNTPTADAYLRKDSPETLIGYVEYSNMALYPMWAHLEEAVVEGTNRWKQTFGFEGGIFTSFFKSNQSRDRFLKGMHGFGQLSSPEVVRAFDLSGFRHLVDLGGGSGHLCLAAIEAYPQMTAAVFDLPPAIEFARRYAGGKVDLITGDFFVDELPKADLYSLARILHDWSDEKGLLLLRRIHAALPSGGGLLIAEKLLGPNYVGAHMQSLNMLVCTEGRERTVEQYRAMLESAGFRDVRGAVTGAPVDAVFARKA
jgi:acetylserotonin O-methyltransferase